MPLNGKEIASSGGGVQQPPLEAGTYPARVVQVINYGLQAQPDFRGKSKEPQYEAGFTYELLDEFCVDEDGDEDETRPRWVFETFPVYNLDADLAKSTKRYKALDPEEEFGGDFLACIELPCMVTLTATEGKGQNSGRIFNNVANVSPMRAKDAARAAELVNDPVVFDFDEPDPEAWLELSSFAQGKLKQSLDFEGSALQEMIENLPDEEDEEEEEPPKKAKRGSKKEPPAAKAKKSRKAAPAKKSRKAAKQEEEEEDDEPELDEDGNPVDW